MIKRARCPDIFQIFNRQKRCEDKAFLILRSRSWNKTIRAIVAGIIRLGIFCFPNHQLDLPSAGPAHIRLVVVESQGKAREADLVVTWRGAAGRANDFTLPTQRTNAEPRIDERDRFPRFELALEDGHIAELDGAGSDGEALAIGILHSRHPLSKQPLDVPQSNLLIADVAQVDDECDGLADLVALLITGPEADARLQAVSFHAPVFREDNGANSW